MFHFTHRYGEVDSKGYQYCKICGKANFIAPPQHEHMWEEQLEGKQKCFICGEISLIPSGVCEHNWVLLESSNITRGKADGIIGRLWVYSCSKCKDIKEQRVNA